MYHYVADIQQQENACHFAVEPYRDRVPGRIGYVLAGSLIIGPDRRVS